MSSEESVKEIWTYLGDGLHLDLFALVFLSGANRDGQLCNYACGTG